MERERQQTTTTTLSTNKTDEMKKQETKGRINTHSNKRNKWQKLVGYECI